MDLITHLTAKTSSCIRTKNRIREHGPVFTILNNLESVPCFNGSPGLYVQSDDGWKGWLPKAEIEGPIIGD